MKTLKERRQRRKLSIRKTLSGTQGIPRIYVFKSNKYIYVGAANDVAHKVILTKYAKKGMGNATKLGTEFGEALKKMKVAEAVFDRGGYKYHGQVKNIADAIRKVGIKF